MNFMFCAASGNIAIGKLVFCDKGLVVDARWTSRTLGPGDCAELEGFIEQKLAQMGHHDNSIEHVVEADENKRQELLNSLKKLFS